MDCRTEFEMLKAWSVFFARNAAGSLATFVPCIIDHRLYSTLDLPFPSHVWCRALGGLKVLTALNKAHAYTAKHSEPAY